MNHICLIEDEQKVAAFITKGLEEHGYSVKTAADGVSGSKAVAAGTVRSADNGCDASRYQWYRTVQADTAKATAIRPY